MNYKELSKVIDEGRDPAAFGRFMMSFFPKRLDYYRSIDPEDVLSVDLRLNGDSAFILVRLEAGKGYSSHMHRKDYEFEMTELHYYKCLNSQLYDRDYEAQIVRKVVRGFEEFMGSVWWNCPAKVTVRIEQELD